MFKAVKDILVVDFDNGYRSQMAEIYLKQYAGHRANVYSAGLEKGEIHPFMIQILEEEGIDSSKITINHLDEYKNIDFDLILTVSNNVENIFKEFQPNVLRFHYNFPEINELNKSKEEIIRQLKMTRESIELYCPKFLKIHLYSNSQSFENFKL
jgi:arsenate reductase